jgi:putative Mg2+ transporter-C (MgtC) family protein
VSPQEIALRLATALLVGAVIGFERQWRQRMAGLRTNALVSIGAAGFVVFSALASAGDSPTRSRRRSYPVSGFLAPV